MPLRFNQKQIAQDVADKYVAINPDSQQHTLVVRGTHEPYYMIAIYSPQNSFLGYVNRYHMRNT